MKKTAKIALILSIFALFWASSTLKAQSADNSGYPTPTEVILTPSAANTGVFDLRELVESPEMADFCLILAQNDPEIEHDTDPEDCCTDLDACERALIKATTDPPDIPVGGLLSSFAWYRKLPAWAKVSISGSINAVIIGGLIYLGTIQE